MEFYGILLFILLLRFFVNKFIDKHIARKEREQRLKKHEAEELEIQKLLEEIELQMLEEIELQESKEQRQAEEQRQASQKEEEVLRIRKKLRASLSQAKKQTDIKTKKIEFQWDDDYQDTEWWREQP